MREMAVDEGNVPQAVAQAVVWDDGNVHQAVAVVWDDGNVDEAVSLSAFTSRGVNAERLTASPRPQQF
jgi:hypothetical protein